MEVFHFVSMRIWSSVRTNQAIVVEVLVRHRETTIITAIGIDLITSYLALVAQTLINKIPDKTTLILRILTDQIPILLESTHRITHGMGILLLKKRFVTIVLFQICSTTVVISIHRTENVSLASLQTSQLV